MKKIILSFFVVVISTTLIAQVRVGIQGAAMISSPEVSGLASKVSNKQWTFAPGIVLDFNILPGLNFRPSANYQSSEYALQNVIAPSGSPSYPALNTVNYVNKNIQIPLDLVFPIKAGKGKLLLAVGPVVTLGLSGEYTISNNSTGPGTVGTYNVTYGNANAEIKKVDWGSNFGLGYRLGSKLDFMAKYKYGFTNQSNQNSSSVKEHIVSIGASYFLFGR
jgi:hypothetical protein